MSRWSVRCFCVVFAASSCSVALAREAGPAFDSRAGAIARPPQGDVVSVKGFARAGDGGAATYRRLSPAQAGLERAADPSRFKASDGSVWELDEAAPTVAMFGAVGDDSSAAALDNVFAFRAAMAYAAARRAPLRVTKGVYRIAGGLYTYSGLHMSFDDGAWLKPTEYSVHGPVPAGAGAFISNVIARGDHTDSVQTDVVIENPHIDGALLPKPLTLRVTEVTGARIVAQPAETISDRLFHGPPERIAAGRMATALTGGAAPATSPILSAEGSSFVVSPGLAARLKPGDLMRIGSNDNALGFGLGMRGVRIRGGLIRNFFATWAGGGSGGKGVNFEKGCFDCQIEGTRFENVSWGVFVQGTPGRAPAPPKGNGQPYGVRDMVARNIQVDHCEAAAGFYGITKDSDPSGDPDVMSARVEGLTATECGAALTRPLEKFRELSGALVFAEAQNVVVRGFTLRNSHERGPLGVNLPIGAVMWGWGRNLSVQGAAKADVVQIARFSRARAMGDDAPPQGQIRNLLGLDVDLSLDGSARTLVSTEPGPIAGRAQDGGADSLVLTRPPVDFDGALVGRWIHAQGPNGEESRMIDAFAARDARISVKPRWDAPAQGAAYRIDGVPRLPPAEARGRLRLRATSLTGPVIDTSMWAYSGLTLDIGDGRPRPMDAFIR